MGDGWVAARLRQCVHGRLRHVCICVPLGVHIYRCMCADICVCTCSRRCACMHMLAHAHIMCVRACLLQAGLEPLHAAISVHRYVRRMYVRVFLHMYARA
jgi:hypothetical protein